MDLSLVFSTFFKSFQSFFTSKMLAAVLLPLIVAFVCYLVLGIFFATPLRDMFVYILSSYTWLNWANTYWFTMALTVISIFVFGLILGLVVASIAVTPMVLEQLSRVDYPHLTKQGKYANLISLANTIKVAVIFIVGWVITLPVWLIPAVGILVHSLFWGAFAFSQMPKVDALVEHANSQERKDILKNHRWGFWMVGLICAILSCIPFVGLFLPVFSIIFCTHFALQLLSNYREEHNTIIQS